MEVKAGMCFARVLEFKGKGTREKIKGGEDSKRANACCKFVMGLWLDKETR